MTNTNVIQAWLHQNEGFEAAPTQRTLPALDDELDGLDDTKEMTPVSSARAEELLSRTRLSR